MSEHLVLCVGLVCVDIVQVCRSYPKEDSDQRCVECYMQRGGNASNNCTVLSQLGVPVEFLGSLSKAMFWEFVEKDFKEDGVSIDHCVFSEGWDIPLSTVIVSADTGSRTIVHASKGYQELTLEDFTKIVLSKYSWIHFEGRNMLEVKKMMEYLELKRGEGLLRAKVSVELEKPKEGLLELVPLADVLFVAKDFALSQAWTSMDEAIDAVKALAKPGATVVCCWGEDGAAGRWGEETVKVRAFPPEGGVVDTLGAGDTFCAGAIAGLGSWGLKLDQALGFASRLAGAKVGSRGYRGLAKAAKDILAQLA